VGFEPILGNRKAIFLKSGNVPADRFFDILDRLAFGPSLTDTARETGALDNPEPVLSRE